MNIDVKSIIGNEGAKIPISGKVDVSESNLAASLKLSGKVYNFSGSINIDADVDCDIETICDRCLVPVKTKLPFSISEVVGENEVSLHGTILDMGDIAEKNFYSALPMKFLCHEDCKGLCPICGTNLNEKNCDCKHDIIDERLAALKKLLK
jgi:uncharacterized protein